MRSLRSLYHLSDGIPKIKFRRRSDAGHGVGLEWLSPRLGVAYHLSPYSIMPVPSTQRPVLPRSDQLRGWQIVTLAKPMLSKPITGYRSAKSGRRAPWYHSASGKQIMRLVRIVGLGIAVVSVLSPTAGSTQGQSEESKPELNNRDDMQRSLSDCLKSVRALECGHEIRLTVRFTFNAHGAFEGPPRITYAEPPVANEIRGKYENAIVETLGRCTPLNFSRNFGSSIAGTPLLLRFVRSRPC
jgi:hypothetical protein